MKETTKTPAKDALIDFIKKLTPEQDDKLVERMRLLKQLAALTPNKLIFTEEFLARLFFVGHESA